MVENKNDHEMSNLERSCEAALWILKICKLNEKEINEKTFNQEQSRDRIFQLI